MPRTKLAVDSRSANLYPPREGEAPTRPDAPPRAFEEIAPCQIDSRWEDHILDYYRAIRLVLAEGELPLIATICHTILLHERKLVPTASIQKVLERNALPYQSINRRGQELTEREIAEWWHRNGE